MSKEELHGFSPEFIESLRQNTYLDQFKPQALLSDDSLLDLIEMGYHLGRHGAYNDVLLPRRRELLKDHLEAFKKTR